MLFTQSNGTNYLGTRRREFRVLAGAMGGSMLNVAVAAALANLLQGYSTGIIAGALLYIVPEFDLAARPEVTGFIASSTTLGAVAGTLLSGPVCNGVGRQRTLVLTSILFMLGGCLMGWSPTVWVLVVGRFISGLGAGFASTAVPTYITECAEPEWRGTLSTLPQLCVSTGILLSYLVSLGALLGGLGWRPMLAASSLLAALQGGAAVMLPESPRWILSHHGDEERARGALQRLRGAASPSAVEAELAAMANGLAAEAQASDGSRGALAVLASAETRRVLLVCSTLQVFQQLSGVNAIVYYTPKILRDAGAPALFASTGVGPDAAAMLATVLAYLPKIPSVLLAAYLIERLGRRQLLLIFLPPLAACLAALALSFGYDSPGGATLAVTLFCVFFGMSLGPMPNILASELFPTAVRSSGVALSSSFQWISNALVAAIFPALSRQLGTPLVLQGFALTCAVAFFFVLRFVPETKGVALEDIGGRDKGKGRKAN